MIDDIRYLIVFAKVAEAKSISRAAELLELAPATVSAHLAKLEANVGAALLYRNTRKLSLTREGAVLLDTARAMLQLYEEGLIDFRKRAISSSALLKVSAPAILLSCAGFMRTLAGFLAEHPALRLDIGFSDHRLDVIGEGLDIAFRIGDLPDSALRAKPVFRLQRQLVAAASVLAQHGHPEHPGQLADLPWIGLSVRPSSRSFVNAQGERAEVRYTPRISTDSVDASYRLAKLGLGLAAPPAYLFHADRDDPPVPVLPGWRLDPLDVHAVWPPNLASSGMAYRLINRVYEAMTEVQGNRADSTRLAPIVTLKARPRAGVVSQRAIWRPNTAQATSDR